jgi:hypothetical protein
MEGSAKQCLPLSLHEEGEAVHLADECSIDSDAFGGMRETYH